MRRARCPAAIPIAALVLFAGCGQPGTELFVVTRTGLGPGAALKLQVADDGYVRCNGGPRLRMSDNELLLAREVQRELDALSKRSYPPGANSVFAYRVELEHGTVSFDDTSPRLSGELRKAAAFTREVATGVCRLAR